MKKHIEELDSQSYKIINKDTGKEIRGVQYADDENGFYEACLFNNNKVEDGVKLCKCCNRFITEIKKGNIEIIKK